MFYSEALTLEVQKIWEGLLQKFPANNNLEIILNSILVSVKMCVRAEDVVKLRILYLAVLEDNRKKAGMCVGTCALNAALKNHAQTLALCVFCSLLLTCVLLEDLTL